MTAEVSDSKLSFDDLFSNTIIELVFNNNSQINDLKTLDQIASKNYDIKTFDYDGNKYNVLEAKTIIDNLNSTIEQNKEALRKNDIEVFKHFYFTAKTKNEHYALLQLYKELFLIGSQHEEKAKVYIEMYNQFSFAYEQLQIKAIYTRIDKYKTLEEKFKEQLRLLLNDSLYTTAVSFDLKVECIDYLNKDLIYFNGKYDNDAIKIKNKVLSNYLYILQRAYFLKKKQLLDFQDQIK